MRLYFTIIKKLLFLLCISCSSCSITTQFVTRTYNKEIVINRVTKRVKYNCFIPKDFISLNVTDSPHGKCFYYSYKDSSVLYLLFDSGVGSLNDENINKLNNDIYSKYFQAKINNEIEKMSVSGEINSGRYWKEQVVSGVRIGYYNATEDRKTFFDKALNKLQVIEKE